MHSKGFEMLPSIPFEEIPCNPVGIHLLTPYEYKCLYYIENNLSLNQTLCTRTHYTHYHMQCLVGNHLGFSSLLCMNALNCVYNDSFYKCTEAKNEEKKKSKKF